MKAKFNTEDSAVASAADLRLASMRDQRVKAAEGKLKAAQQRLADAQQAEQDAAQACADYESQGNRAALLSAREEIELSTSLADHADRKLTEAKARVPEAHREAMVMLVKAARSAAGFTQRMDPIIEQIEDHAALLIAAAKEAFAEIGTLHGIRNNQKRAAQALGLDAEPMVTVPNYELLVAQAILKACTAQGWTPFQWKDLDPTRLTAPQRVPMEGSRAVIEDVEDTRARQRAWQDRMHNEAENNSANARDAEREIARGGPPPAPARSSFAERTSLTEEYDE